MRIGLDANVLLRALLDDDPVQSAKASELLQSLDEGGEGHVGVTVLLEVFWVLKSRYRIPRAELAQTLQSLLSIRSLELESFDCVVRALKLYAEGQADFPDALLAARNIAAKCSRTVTFDKAAARAVPGMELLT